MVGLGNPGAHYAQTRHNVGWLAIDRLARSLGVEVGLKEGPALTGRAGDVLLAKPTTFMNNSGSAVKSLLARHEIPLDRLLVISDDFSLPLGALRVRRKGIAGGQKGLADILATLGTSDWARLRLGVGPRPPDADAAEFALSTFPKSERSVVEEMVSTAAEAALVWARDGIDAAMDRFNRLPAPSGS